MPEFLPFAGKNSIQEALVGIHFAGRLPPKSVEAMYHHVRSDLANDFPKGDLIQLVEMQFNTKTGAQPFSQQAGGFEFSRLRADGKPQRVLRLVDTVMTVNYLAYDEWANFAPPAIQWLRLALSRADLTQSPIVAFSLRYIDRFTYDGPPSDAVAGLLFKAGTKHLNPRAFESGPVWHCHTGWYEGQPEPGAKILNQLNIQSAPIDEAPSVLIDHNAVCQLGSPRQSIDALVDPAGSGKLVLKRALDEMHGTNEIIVRELLLPEMADKIGLPK